MVTLQPNEDHYLTTYPQCSRQTLRTGGSFPPPIILENGTTGSDGWQLASASLVLKRSIMRRGTGHDKKEFMLFEIGRSTHRNHQATYHEQTRVGVVVGVVKLVTTSWSRLWPRLNTDIADLKGIVEGLRQRLGIPVLG